MIYLSFLLFASIRLLFLRYSIKQEKALIAAGGVEYGEKVSFLLAIIHTIIYFSAFFEGIIRKIRLDSISVIGLLLIGLSYAVLVYIIHLLGKFWTVKLMIASDHVYIDHWLFRKVKHPNYFFNLIPELIGIILFFHAWLTGIIGLPIYMIILMLRIKEENEVNKQFKRNI
ncbi:isoprenylcysteine carboxylmethyltransferase family protein [Enterococcus wangshanyuanii]|uniref:Isoprenylcysteine carboxyl methyltransferase n=1 Tax=Enterococcus wangshanyuanii TaxID=2005703 RepID=A0ABQ1P6B1_9ENTE|nr:isoprenylcysteine carboxylmethyltransferase family protein [Enterococcus wangshanyuanii]GGC91952.1 hypothetical protein GCM10011573_21920 [Enterococcus wangshanyuanii]